MRQGDHKLGSTRHSLLPQPPPRKQTSQSGLLPLLTWKDRTFPDWVLFLQPLVVATDDFSKAWITPYPVLFFPDTLSPRVQSLEVIFWSVSEPPALQALGMNYTEVLGMNYTEQMTSPC